MCELYLGATNSYSSTPPSPFWTNPSIQSATYTFTVGTAYPLTVVLQNADTTGGCSGALVNLYWSDPTTSFLLQTSNLIGTAGAAVPAATPATTIPPAPQMDGSASLPFSWTPTSAASGTNGGHVCLAAIAQCTSSDCFTPAPCAPPQPATTSSPLVAIHNTQVNPAPPGPMPPPPGGGGGGGGSRWIWPFLFGAANGGNVTGLTRIVARAYNPDDAHDRLRILHLAGLPSVRQAYGRCMKFGTPAEVLLALGAESVVVPPASREGSPIRLGATGMVSTEMADELVKRDWARAPGSHAVTKEVELIPRQVQQVAVQVVPRDDDGRIYAVEIGHELVVKGAPAALLGGLTVLFAAPCRPW